MKDISREEAERMWEEATPVEVERRPGGMNTVLSIRMTNELLGEFEIAARSQGKVRRRSRASLSSRGSPWARPPRCRSSPRSRAGSRRRRRGWPGAVGALAGLSSRPLQPGPKRCVVAYRLRMCRRSREASTAELDCPRGHPDGPATIAPLGSRSSAPNVIAPQ